MKIALNISKTTRQLASACMYFVCALLGIINLGLTAYTYNSIDLILTAIGVTAWSIASTQGLFVTWRAKKSVFNQAPNTDIELGIASEVHENSVQLAHPNDERGIRGSTYSTIGAALNMVSSACFIASDMHNVQSADAQLIARLFGSGLWFKSASLYCWMSRSYQRKQEDNPALTIKHFGFNAIDLNFMGNVEYLASAFYYAGSIWSSNPINPLKAAGNVCWIVAGIHDTTSAYLDLRNNNIQRNMTLFPAPVAIASPIPQLTSHTPTMAITQSDDTKTPVI
jgi:hypothetical protein